MPDLTHEGAKQFWSEFMNGSIYDVIAFIEQAEHWTVSDDPRVVEALETLSKKFENADSKTSFSHDHLIRICAYVHLSQKLKIMQELDTIHPGLATKLIQSAEQAPPEDKDAATFLKRNVIFERMRILSRILTPKRIQMVQKIYES